MHMPESGHNGLALSQDWLTATSAKGEQVVWLLLLDLDLQSAQIALEDYLAASSSVTSGPGPGVNPTALARQIHSAKMFVCSMRRVGRLLQSGSARRSIFPGEVAQVIKQAWKSKRTFFESYVEPRNAIEHIDGEIKGRANWIMVNLVNDWLEVVPGKRAQVSPRAMRMALDIRNDIVAAVKQHLPSRSFA